MDLYLPPPKPAIILPHRKIIQTKPKPFALFLGMVPGMGVCGMSGGGGGLKPVGSRSLQGVDTADGTTSATSFTFTGIAIGPEDPSRMVVLCPRQSYSGSVNDIDSVTLGGNTTTIVSQESRDTDIGKVRGVIAQIDVPTGTTATVVVNNGAGVTIGRTWIAIYALYNLTSHTATTNKANSQGTSVSTTLDVPANGIVICHASSSGDNPTVSTFTGVTQDGTFGIGVTSDQWFYGSLQGAAAETGRTLSLTGPSASTERIIQGASWA